MTTIQATMADNHRFCDEFFIAAEQAAHSGDMAACQQKLGQFASELERHLQLEEQSLFPRFEASTGMTAGPTAVMRMEHEQMRELVAQMQAQAAAGDRNTFLGTAETLLILMQQHNLKEENVLYPMLDRVLAADAASLVQPILTAGEHA